MKSKSQFRRVALTVAGVVCVAWLVASIDLSFPNGARETQAAYYRKLGFGVAGSTVPIEARGRRFHWSFRYPGLDRQLGTPDDVVVERNLRLPSGHSVELSLESEDYVYSLSCPSLGLKEIAVPDLTHVIRFETDVPGSHALVTDPMCGWRPFHDDLMGQIIVEPIEADKIRAGFN